jgi:hypothetical protein
MDSSDSQFRTLKNRLRVRMLPCWVHQIDHAQTKPDEPFVRFGSLNAALAPLGEWGTKRIRRIGAEKVAVDVAQARR